MPLPHSTPQEQGFEPRGLYSLSKSFTSTAVGLAVAEGLFALDDRVLDLLPDKAPSTRCCSTRSRTPAVRCR